jgi:hypothetical protein
MAAAGKVIVCAGNERNNMNTGNSKGKGDIRRRAAAVAIAAAMAASAVPVSVYAAGSSDSGNSQGGQSGVPSMPGGGSGGGADTMTYDYTGTLSGVLKASGTTKRATNKKIKSTKKDVNTALAKSGGILRIKNSKLYKSGSDTNGDNCNFYGINSILLATGKSSKAYISGSTLKASSQGSNGIFATNSGKVYANKDKIYTTADNSRGLDATYSGLIVANRMTISTKGDHSAAVATDRGGGKISVTNSSLKTAGSGSPLLYSTGNIQVDNVTGTASGSQIAGIEGSNTVLINNSKLTSTNTSKTASDPIANGIIIYQSTSGDAESSTGDAARFQAVNSTLKSSIKSGSMFYLTNTTANVVLQNTKVSYSSSKADLLTAEGNSSNNWGSAGSNGADVTFTCRNETIKGDVSCDSISSVDMYLLKGTKYTGAVEMTDNSSGSSSDSGVTMNIDSSSKWVVTDDTEVTNLNAASGAKIVDENGKTVNIVVDGETVVDGSSDVTVTVTGDYSTTVKTDSDNSVSKDYISRTYFDKYFGTSTKFGRNKSSKSSSSKSSSKKSSKKLAAASLTAAGAA